MALTHTQAKQIVDGLVVTDVESLFLRAVAWHETKYGAAWKPSRVKRWFGPPIDWHPGSNAPWNVGAITTGAPDGLSFSHQDSRFDDKTGAVKQYTTWFAGDPTPAAAFARLMRTVLKPEVKAALAVHDIQQGVTGMYDQHYFLGLHTHENVDGDRLNITDYYAAVARAIETIGAETGEKHPVVLPPVAVREP